MRTKTVRTPSGFTLIEMLVVMAVILTLLGLIMPSLSGVRDRADTALCASNLHQLGIAFTNYLNDNNGWFPGTSPYTAEGQRRDNWIWWVGGAGTCGYLDKHSAIFAYVDNPGLFACPADDESPTWRCGTTSAAPSARLPLSYGMNNQLTHGGVCPPDTTNNCDNPMYMMNRKEVTNGELSRYILLCEDELSLNNDTHIHSKPPAGKGAGYFNTGEGGNMSTRHNGKSNLLFIDGHVELAKRCDAGGGYTQSGGCTKTSFAGSCTPAGCPSTACNASAGASCTSTITCTAVPAGASDCHDPFGYCTDPPNELCPWTPQRYNAGAANPGGWTHP